MTAGVCPRVLGRSLPFVHLKSLQGPPVSHTMPIPLPAPSPAAPVTVTLPLTRIQPPRRVATAGIVMALTSAIAFAASGPLVKPLLEAGWSLTTVLTLRMGLAGLVLSPALVRAIRARPGFLRRNAVSLVLFGLMPVAGCQVLYFSALQRMPVAVALLIQYLAPVFLVLFAWVRTRAVPSRLVLAGSGIAVAGLVLVVDIGGAQFDPLGTIFALGAALCVCVYFTMSARAGDDLPPLALSAGGLLVGTVVLAALGATGIMPFTIGASSVVFQGAEIPAWLPILYVGAVGTSVGYALGVMAMPRVGERLGSFLGLSEVLFALMFAWMLLGETPLPIQFVGGVLILGGVVLIRRDAQVGTPAGEIGAGRTRIVRRPRRVRR